MDKNIHLAKFLSENLKDSTGTTFSQKEILVALEKFQKSNPRFTNKFTEGLYEDNKDNFVNELRGTGSDGKVTADDVRRAMGEETKSRTPDEFASTSARELADSYGFTSDDFDDNLRHGSKTKAPLASGHSNRINIDDVRALAVSRGVAKDTDVNGLFSSPGVAKFARENNLSPSDFDIKDRKIKREDVKELLSKKSKASGNSETDSANPFDEISNE